MMLFWGKLKHWQLFILFILVATVSIITFRQFLFVLFIYLWSFGVGLSLAEKNGYDVSFFKFNSILMIVFSLTFSFLGINEYSASGFEALIMCFPMVYIMFANLHVLTFPMKQLKSIELQTDATFKNYWLLFFGVVYYPIGIWFIQPRINKILSDTNREQENIDQ